MQDAVIVALVGDTINGIGHHYLTAGSGPTLVLIHGFPQTSRESIQSSADSPIASMS